MLLTKIPEGFAQNQKKHSGGAVPALEKRESGRVPALEKRESGRVPPGTYILRIIFTSGQALCTGAPLTCGAKGCPTHGRDTLPVQSARKCENKKAL